MRNKVVARTKWSHSQRVILLAIGLSYVLFLSGENSCTAEATVASRPNFLILMADDQYRPTIGCYGANPSHTPNINRLARDGIRFTQCFTPSSICTANRAVFLSGMLPLKNGAHANHSGFDDGVKSLPNYMKELGYRACIFNKDGIRRPSDIYEWEYRFVESDQPLPGASEPPSRRHLKSRFDEMEAIMASDDDRPFCIFHASRLPHTPYMGKLANGLEGYDASNFSLDQEFGQALALLEKHELAKSTVVIYVNDNEAGAPRTKYTLYEPGIIVPCIVRWPGHTPAGSVTDAMVSFLDFLPTLVQLAGGQPDAKWDGKSMLDVWEGKTNQHNQELYFSYTGVSVGVNNRSEIPFPIRAYRTRKYKYIRNLNHAIGHPKQQGIRVPAEELYDIQIDSREQINLASNPDYADVKKQLSSKVDDSMRKTNDQGIESELEALQKHPPVIKRKPKGNGST
ncbi:sulfatase [Pirellulales bacterium]|nr:sulfatase [Pirellulales bacterium]